MTNVFKSWWYRRRRVMDIKIFWPACVRRAKNLDNGKVAFTNYAYHDPAWVYLGKDKIDRIITELVDQEHSRNALQSVLDSFQNQIVLEYHTIRIAAVGRMVTIELGDGSTACASPHDTPEYLAYAQEVGAGDVDTQCIQHDVAHAIFGEMLDGESPVLNHVARGTVFPQEQLDMEEVIVKLLQTYFNKFGWPSNLKQVMSGLHFTSDSESSFINARDLL